MRSDRPSLTATLVAAVRALYTALPPPYDLAPDPYAAELVPAIFALPAHAARLAPRAAPAIHRAMGVAALGLTYHVALRTRAIDDALRDAIDRGARQLVVLGAGLDSRAERLDALAETRVFEVDHPSTQRFKIARLSRAGARPRAREVTRVAVDFERDRLDRSLLEAGFDASERAFWIWEGVTVYLTPDAIASTLAAVRALSAASSRIAVTYTRPGRRHGPPLLDAAARSIAGVVGEPVRGMMESETMARALGDARFTRISDENACDWAARYWPNERPPGEWERLAVAERAG